VVLQNVAVDAGPLELLTPQMSSKSAPIFSTQSQPDFSSSKFAKMPSCLDFCTSMPAPSPPPHFRPSASSSPRTRTIFFQSHSSGTSENSVRLRKRPIDAQPPPRTKPSMQPSTSSPLPHSSPAPRSQPHAHVTRVGRSRMGQRLLLWHPRRFERDDRRRTSLQAFFKFYF
jgi:hypothetical protein